MHIPGGASQTVELLDFETALTLSGQGDSYDRTRWIYVPDFYTEYRYILGTRGLNPLICIGVNPSTAEPDNLDPVGIHTGDSVVVCPSQTITNKEYHMLRDSALRIIRALEIEGGCNVQFALDPDSFQYYLIEVNPRVSRSSALASKASGYPIARVSAKIGIGMTLDEIPLANTCAAFEPALDYVVCKIPRFPFDKFNDADNTLGTQMKATGEVMSVGRTFEESLLKAVRSLENGSFHLHIHKFDDYAPEKLLNYIRRGTDDRIFAIAQLLRLGSGVEDICSVTRIDRFFITKIRNIVLKEEALRHSGPDADGLFEAKRMGFSDREIALLWDMSEESVYEMRKNLQICPVYKMIDTCASEFESYVPYFFSTYETENESVISDRRKIIVLGSGPIRIGQGIEFDYSTVHAVQTIQSAGYEAIIINNNPETVSTDYTCSDKLYFEPLYIEDVMNIIDLEKPDGVIVTLGGQTAINLASALHRSGVRIIGTDFEAIERAEDRDTFERLLISLDIPQPKYFKICIPHFRIGGQRHGHIGGDERYTRRVDIIFVRVDLDPLFPADREDAAFRMPETRLLSDHKRQPDLRRPFLHVPHGRRIPGADALLYLSRTGGPPPAGGPPSKTHGRRRKPQLPLSGPLRVLRDPRIYDQ